MVETDPAWVQQALFLRSKLMRTTETFIYDVLQHARVPPQIPAKGSRLYPAPALCLRAVPDPAGGCSLGFLFFGVLSLRNVLRLRPDDRGSNVLAYRMSSNPAFANNSACVTAYGRAYLTEPCPDCAKAGCIFAIRS
jgi:hypothetical protein